MKYSITILQAEITRFENGIKANKARIIKHQKDETKESSKWFPAFKQFIAGYEKQITELKADIKKL